MNKQIININVFNKEMFNLLIYLTLFILMFGEKAEGCFPLLQPSMSPSCFQPSIECPSTENNINPYSTYESGPSPYSSYGEYQSPDVYSYPSSPYGSPPQQPYYHASKSRTMPSVADETSKDLKTSPNLDSCFRRFSDTKIICALPFERKTPTNERECKKNCLNSGPRCRSFQYDPAGNVCDLFEHSIAPPSTEQTTTIQPSISLSSSTPTDPFAALDDWDSKKLKKHSLSLKMLSASKLRTIKERVKRFSLHNGVPLDEHSQNLAYGSNLHETGYSKQMSAISEGNDLSSYSSSSKCVPMLEHKIGVIFTGLEQGCESSGLNNFFDEYEGDRIGEQKDNNEQQQQQQLLEDIEDIQTLKPIPPPTTTTTKINTNQKQELEPMKNLIKNRKEQTMPEKSNNKNTVEVNEVESLSKINDCSNGQQAKIQLIDGISLIGQLPLLLAVQLESADVCLQVCRQNKNLDGLDLSNSCRSATFNRQSGRCELLNDTISPNGPLQYIPNPDSIYFEKLCISGSDLIDTCDDIIHRIPQHHLDSRKSINDGASVNALNQVECIKNCINAKNKLGFECASASFFFDWQGNNCFLSRFTRLSRPDLYSAERKELVDYMEIPLCFRLNVNNVKQRDVLSSTINYSPKSSKFSSKEESIDDSNSFSLKNDWSACIGGIRWRPKLNCNNTNNNNNNCLLSEACTANNNNPKPIAPSIEVAKRFKAPDVSSNEASLYGEQDYENQKEISFFGPPHEAEINTDNTAAEIPSNCDPTKNCCPISENGEIKGIVRGCSLGTRRLSDGRAVSCVPDKCH
ncbi:hypothetical protein Mgra_00008741 [Meloidogyne graminicola]|uniref:Apple domain-containing protein n=1 Tax=Meloidogyne graminicola TaxID=189291 RepID=A0A8S9ZEW7_9BILA|nr:hypothetical protein Mgra_00008741 [Meloidogyne graminicola]